MFQEEIRNEYERSIDRVRGRRDRAYQIARISGIMFAIFGTVMIFTLSRGGETHAFPEIIFITGFAVLAVFGIVLPVIFAYVLREPPQELLVDSLELARRGVITDGLLYEFMILCTHLNRETVRGFERLITWVVIPEISWGVLMILGAIVWLYL